MNFKMTLSKRGPLVTRMADYALRLPYHLLASRNDAAAVEPLKILPRRLLIVKVHGLGDSVLVRAIIETLTRTHPEVEIGVMAGAATKELMTAGMDVKTHYYDQKKVAPRSAFNTWNEIRRKSYDAIANFEQGSLAGTAFVSSTGIKTHAGFIQGEGDPKLHFLSHPVKFRHSDSMWQSFLRVARLLYPDLPDQAVSISLDPSDHSQGWVAEWWREHVGDCIAVGMHLGCGPGMDFKRWPVSRFATLASRLKVRWRNALIILTGTTLEKGLINRFREIFDGVSIDASNVGSIEKTALILKRCRLLVSNDTGVMHLGAAIGTPTVGLFGATSPLQWAPLGRCAAYVRETNLPCSPCVDNYSNRMPAKCINRIAGQCMDDIAVAAVESAIDQVLAVANT